MIGLKDKIMGGIAGLLVVLLLASAIETRHWKKKAANAEDRLAVEVAGHQQTKAGYRQAQDDADRLQRESNKRVEDARASVSREIERDYEERLADVRLRAERLRRQAEARAGASGGPRHDPVPGAAGATGRADEAAAQAGLPDAGGMSDQERLIATEQALQLEALQRWVREVVGIR